MNSVLIVSSSSKGKTFLEELLKLNSYSEIITASCSSEVTCILAEKDFDLCIINTPLTDEFGTDLALFITNKFMVQVMMIVRGDMIENVSSQVDDYGVFVASKMINRQAFANTLKLISAASNRMKKLKSENVQLQKKIDDMRYISRAKCVLIEYLKMTELEAHRFIEKQSMDMRISKREVAVRILKTYES